MVKQLKENQSNTDIIHVTQTSATMPRVLLYHTTEEKKAANREKSLRSYYK